MKGDPFFLFTLKDNTMTVYIVREENQLKIIKVKPELEDDFQADYAGKISCQAIASRRR